MRVVIADDENLARYSLRSMLAETDPEVTVVGEAVNGDELTLLVRRLRPDIAFVDIRMPHLDGLRAIERCTATSPGTQWVVLTSYPEFDYAREALRLGVSEYLLKPVSPEELHAVVTARTAAISAERASSGEEFEGFVNAVLHHTAAPESRDGHPALRDARATAVVIVLDARGRTDAAGAETPAAGSDDVAGRNEPYSAFTSSVRAVLRESASSRQAVAFVPVAAGVFCVVSAWPNAVGEEGEASFKRLVNRIGRASADDAASLATLVVTETRTDFAELAADIREIVAHRGLRSVAGAGTTMAAATLIAFGANDDARRGSILLEATVSAANSGVALATRSAVEAAREWCERSPLLDGRAVCASIVRFLGSARSPDAGNELPPARSGSTGRATIIALLDALRNGTDRGASGGRTPVHDLVRQVRDYVDLHFAEGLSIADIARRIEVTPNYLSNLFHRECGVRFVEYVAARRIDRAKVLLSTTRMSVGDVAAAVGYGGGRHFGRMFRQITGTYPSDFRARNASGVLKTAPKS